MAGLKKQKKEKSSNPNVVLIIFLVFFFLVSIGLGIWGYYGYAGQDDLRRAKFTSEAAAKGGELGRQHRKDVCRGPQVAGRRTKRAGADDHGVRACTEQTHQESIRRILAADHRACRRFGA